ncbi:hypothetical protein ACH3VR_11890 [Microbacterium sp. B2969]|uniref:HTH marR-type domain-containing protein n=1 Tax=Microbacterium alkaliflavum TaxID=3248839 RepID=A0ABW7Q872_9MICO
MDDIQNPGDETPDTTSDTPTDRRPLGYWLRTVDGLISREFAAAFAEEGVSRGEWMLLSALAGDIDEGLAQRLARKGKRLRGLERRGWALEQGDGTWVLTDEGRAAKERLGTVVDGIRARVAGAVSPEDFATTLGSLESIARELGWDESAPLRGFGLGRRFGFRGEGFGPDFGGPFGPGFRPGFGPGFRPGFGGPFGPGFRPGFGGPGFRPGFGPRPDFADEHEHGHAPGYGHDPRRAWAEGWDDGCHGHGRHSYEHGHLGHHHDRGAHRRHGDAERHGHDPRRHAEDAYERGFDAGYSRGAAERA